MSTHSVKGNRFFLYVGSVLNFLALLCLPAKIRVVVQPEVMETELWSVGPIFALMIGVWSLPMLLLGVIDSSASRKTVFHPSPPF